MPHPQTWRRQKPNARTQSTPFQTKRNWQEEAYLHLKQASVSTDIQFYSLYFKPFFFLCSIPGYKKKTEKTTRNYDSSPLSLPHTTYCWATAFSPRNWQHYQLTDFTEAVSSQLFISQLIKETWITSSQFCITSLFSEVITGAWNTLLFWKLINLSLPIYSTHYSTTKNKKSKKSWADGVTGSNISNQSKGLLLWL